MPNPSYSSSRVTIRLGDIFDSNADGIVIPRSTTRTLDSAFERGLNNLGISHQMEYRTLGSVDFEIVCT